MRLVEALGDLVDIPHFFVWRLTWSPSENKFKKTPCYPDPSDPRIMSAQNPDNWMTYPDAVATLARLKAAGGDYALGWFFTEDTGYWFLDVDGCISPEGELSQEAAYFYQALPGAFSECSSSGRGLHFIGRGTVPQHACKHTATNMEFYTHDRGIAFGINDQAEGCADTDHSQAVAIIVGHWFPYVEVAKGTVGDGPRADWRGPTDDAELLRRAVQSASVGSMVGGKASFADLWHRNLAVLAVAFPPSKDDSVFGESEADGALAMQLAFWTGCDAGRIERLMRQSGLKRDKWDEHATYLRELTITRACAGVSRVLVDAEVVAKVDVSVSVDQQAANDTWIHKVMNADENVLRNEVVPAIAADRSIEVLDRDRLANLIKNRLADFDIPVTIGMCRKMLQVSKVDSDDDAPAIPAFATEHVYIERSDTFFHLPTATELSKSAFCAKFNRAMPAKGNGDKEDAAKWSLERWGMRTVYDMMYLPDQGDTFTHANRTYANMYSPSSIPTLAGGYSEVGVAGIQAFARHLEHFCGKRPEVYGGVLAWMAFNVQNPGVKVRYAPIFKGVQGDGKSLITSVMAAAMGMRNVSSVGPAIVLNSGGFTDWAHGACIIGMEEMMMTGKGRHAMANAIKENITNGNVTINRKGKTQLPILNVSNFICYTNHVDAIPLEDSDRRWWVIFSPYNSAHDVAKALGLDGLVGLGEFFDVIWKAVKECGGELRKWLLEMDVPAWFRPNGHAPDTVEKNEMRASGEDDLQGVARQVIEKGCPGVGRRVVSSAALSTAMRAVCIAEGTEIPKTTRLNNLLSQMGYSAQGVVTWNGRSHRIWSIGVRGNEALRAELDTTVTSYEFVTPNPIS